jgi:hypothetical protein
MDDAGKRACARQPARPLYTRSARLASESARAMVISATDVPTAGLRGGWVLEPPKPREGQIEDLLADAVEEHLDTGGAPGFLDPEHEALAEEAMDDAIAGLQLRLSCFCSTCGRGGFLRLESGWGRRRD